MAALEDVVDTARIEQAVGMILEAVGENPGRAGLQATPARVARACAELFVGTNKDPAAEIDVFFDIEHDEMVLVKDISFYSLCEHHLLPFFGRAHVAYIPRDGRLTGLSKLARVVETAARRLQVQERLTNQIATAVISRLAPAGVLVVIEAEHLCMTMRGINKPGSVTVTSAVHGIFRENEKTRAEAFAIIGNQG